MPKVKRQIARTNLYVRGARVEDPKTKSGFRVDRSKPYDEKDQIFVKKGQMYFTWKFRYGGTRRSVTYPKPSELTMSEFLQTAYAFYEKSVIDYHEGITAKEIQDAVQERIDKVQELLDEQEEKISNMESYGLENTPAGEKIQRRVEALQEMVSEYEQYTDIEDEEDLDKTVDEINQISYEGE